MEKRRAGWGWLAGRQQALWLLVGTTGHRSKDLSGDGKCLLLQ